jgi:hypothetical protein
VKRIGGASSKSISSKSAFVLATRAHVFILKLTYHHCAFNVFSLCRYVVPFRPPERHLTHCLK